MTDVQAYKYCESEREKEGGERESERESEREIVYWVTVKYTGGEMRLSANNIVIRPQIGCS